MSSAKLSGFSNPFSRISIPIKVEWNVSPIPSWLILIFTDKREWLDGMLTAEAMTWTTTGNSRARSAMADNKYMQMFAEAKSGMRQVPIFCIHILCAIVVFSDAELRAAFQLNCLHGTKISAGSVCIYENIRLFQINNSLMEISSNISDEIVEAYELQGTILDKEFLKANESARTFAFGLVKGLPFAGDYEYQLIPFNHVNFNSEKAEVNAISTEYGVLGDMHNIVLRIAGWSTMAWYNGKPDPSQLQGLLGLFVGSYFTSAETGEVISLREVSFTEFAMPITGVDYWILFIQTFVLFPSGLMNPLSTRKPYKTKYGNDWELPSKEDGKGEIAAASIIGVKAYDCEQILFANRLFYLNRNWFYSFVKRNRLYNRRIRFRGKELNPTK